MNCDRERDRDLLCCTSVTRLRTTPAERSVPILTPVQFGPLIAMPSEAKAGLWLTEVLFTIVDCRHNDAQPCTVSVTPVYVSIPQPVVYISFVRIKL